jgi:hypothetical protein
VFSASSPNDDRNVKEIKDAAMISSFEAPRGTTKQTNENGKIRFKLD